MTENSDSIPQCIEVNSKLFSSWSFRDVQLIPDMQLAVWLIRLQGTFDNRG